MNLFRRKPTYSVCKQCSVHFEPADSYEARWGDLCPTHRAPVKEIDLRMDAVVQWARNNWKEIEPQYLEYHKKMAEAQQMVFMVMGRQWPTPQQDTWWFEPRNGQA